jgi:hypothetical protein
MRHAKRAIKPAFTVMLIILIMLAIFCSSCNERQTSTEKNPSPTSTASLPNTASNTVKSSDGSLSILAPDGWRSDNELWAGSDIGLSGWDYYVVVLKKPKADFASGLTANDFLTAAHSDFEGFLYNINWKQSSDITIGGLHGVTVQMNAKNQGNRAALSYLVTVVADNNNFYEIIGWTSSDRGDIDLTYLQNVMNSLQTK